MFNKKTEIKFFKKRQSNCVEVSSTNFTNPRNAQNCQNLDQMTNFFHPVHKMVPHHCHTYGQTSIWFKIVYAMPRTRVSFNAIAHPIG